MEVAAGGSARGAAQGDGVAAVYGLAYLDGERRQVVVRGLEAIAVVNDHAVASAVLVPSGERNLAGGRCVHSRAALGNEVLATVEVTCATREGADAVTKRGMPW